MIGLYILLALLTVIAAAALMVWKADKETLKWLRDKFAAWLANTTAFSFMWLSVFFAVAVLFVWDGVWATHQAPEGMELSYRAAGWSLRGWVVFSLVGVVALYKKRAYATGSALLVTWIAASVMTYGHAVGFMAMGQMERYASAKAITDIEDVVTVSVTEQLAELDRQIEGIRADRNADVEALELSLATELEDGNSRNDDAAREKYTALLTERREKAADDISRINQLKLVALQDRREASTTAADDASTVVSFDPLYIWIAHAKHGRDATDDQIRSIAAAVGAFWAFLVELLAGAGPAILYAAHVHFADRRDLLESEDEENPEPRVQSAPRPAPAIAPEPATIGRSRGGRAANHSRKADDVLRVAIPSQINSLAELDGVKDAAQ